MTNHDQQVKDLQDQMNGIVDNLGGEISPETKKQFLEMIPKILVEGKSAREALGFTPGMMEEIYLYGYNFFYSGKYKEALPVFNFLRQIDPDDARYTFAIAACHQLLKDYLNATVNYIYCGQLDPFNPLSYFHLYDCFKKTDHLFSAYHALLEAQIFAEENSEYAVLKEKIALELEGFKPIFDEYVREKYGQSADGEVLE